MASIAQGPGKPSCGRCTKEGTNVHSTVGRLTAPVYYRWFHHRREPRRDRIRRALLQSQFWGYDDLRGLQERKLRRLFAQASRTSSWYRERLGDLPAPDRVQLDDLARLPILEKADLQQHLDEITGDGRLIPGVFEEFSGGSTGAPVRLFHTSEHFAYANAEIERDFSMCNGYTIGEPRAFVWGAPRDERSLARWKDAVQNRLWLGGLAVEGADVHAYIARLRSFGPRLLVGYVSILLELAREMDRPLEGLRAVQSSAETLTDEYRKVIGEAFGAPVYNRYGAREVGNLAHECDEHSGLHLLMENNIVEIVDADGRPLTEPGDEGDVVVTNLNNFATPLIRYRLGDVARVGERECRCGRGSPLLASILGRTSGMIVTPSGRRLHGEFFTHLFYGLPVRQFRVEQVTETELAIDVVPDAGYGEDVRDRVTRSIYDEGDSRFVVDWREVDELTPSASGKFHFTTSRLSSAPDAAVATSVGHDGS